MSQAWMARPASVRLQMLRGGLSCGGKEGRGVLASPALRSAALPPSPQRRAGEAHGCGWATGLGRALLAHTHPLPLSCLCSRPVSFPETPYTASPAGVDKVPPYRQPSGSFSTPGSATYARYKPSPERSDSLLSFPLRNLMKASILLPREMHLPDIQVYLPFYGAPGFPRVLRGLLGWRAVCVRMWGQASLARTRPAGHGSSI